MHTVTQTRIVRTVNQAIESLIAQGKMRRDANGKVGALISDVDATVGKWQLLFSLLRRIGESCPAKQVIVKELLEAEAAYHAHATEFDEVMKVALRILPDAIQGLNETHVKWLALEVALNNQGSVYQFSKALIQAMRQQSVEHRRLILSVTGAPQLIAEPFCSATGFDAAIGCEYFVNQSILTGERDETPAIRKSEVLGLLFSECGIDPEKSYGAGDGEVDLPMLTKLNRHGRWAINPKPDLMAYIRDNSSEAIVYVSDHRSTGVQFLMSGPSRSFHEVTRREAMPLDLAAALPPLRGECPWAEADLGYSWT